VRSYDIASISGTYCNIRTILSILALRHLVLDDQGRLHQDLFLHANVQMYPSIAMTLCTFRCKGIPTPMMGFTAQSAPSCACTILS
jgi:hypothetical protein